MRCGSVVAAFLLGMSFTPAVAAADPAPPPAVKVPTATEALATLRHDTSSRPLVGTIYQWLGGGLVGFGTCQMLLTNPGSPTASGRLNLASGVATILSGVDFSYSGLPLLLEPIDLEQRIATHGGESAMLNEAVAREVLQEHAAWAFRWRISTLVVSTVLLAANGAVLAWYAARYSYERVATGVVAGLYGLGVAVVPWYDSYPWPEEIAYANLKSADPAPVTPAPAALRIAPGVVPTPQGTAFSMAVSGSW